MSLFFDGTTTRSGCVGSRRHEAVERVAEVALDRGHRLVGGREVVLAERGAVLAVEDDVAAIEVLVSGKSSASWSKPLTDS